MNAPNFKAVLHDIRAVQADEAEQERSIAKRLAPLGWSVQSSLGSARNICSPDYDYPIAKVEAYPPMRKRDQGTGKYVPARVPSSSEAIVLADLIVHAVNCHDALCEALIEALPELREGYAKAMVIRALELAHAGSGLSDADLHLASDYLGTDGYAHIRDSAPEMNRAGPSDEYLETAIRG